MKTLYIILILSVCLVGGYLFGSISNGIILSKRVYNKDVRDYGSHNSGGTNVTRVFGARLGLICILLDMLKTIIPLYLSFFILKYSALNTFSLENYGYLITSFGVLIGHCYPIFYSFQGGKAVSCFAGIIVATSWVLFIIGFILIFSIFILSKKVSLASMITASSLALISYLLILCPHYVMNFHLVNNLSYALFLTIAALILIIRHKDNIVRLIKHQENKLDLTKK